MQNYLTEKTRTTCTTSSALNSSLSSQTNNSVHYRKVVQKCIRLDQQQTGQMVSFSSSDHGIECKDKSEEFVSHKKHRKCNLEKICEKQNSS